MYKRKYYYKDNNKILYFPWGASKNLRNFQHSRRRYLDGYHFGRGFWGEFQQRGNPSCQGEFVRNKSHCIDDSARTSSDKEESLSTKMFKCKNSETSATERDTFRSLKREREIRQNNAEENSRWKREVKEQQQIKKLSPEKKRKRNCRNWKHTWWGKFEREIKKWSNHERESFEFLKMPLTGQVREEWRECRNDVAKIRNRNWKMGRANDAPLCMASGVYMH